MLAVSLRKAEQRLRALEEEKMKLSKVPSPAACIIIKDLMSTDGRLDCGWF